MSRITFRRPSLALAGILIGIGGCSESPSAPAAPAATYHFLAAPAAPSMSKSGESSSAVIGQAGGVLSTPGGHRIVFPAGALDEPTRISIRADQNFAGVDLQPHGLRFPAGHQPVLSINVGSLNLSRFSQLNVVYVSDNNAVLEVLPTALNGQRLEARLRHFSGYIGAGS
jgi:hypothetical protein